LAICLVLPWLNGFYAGPTPNLWPWLVSAVCGVIVALGWGRVSARLLALTWLAAALISSVMALLQYFGLASALAPWLSPTLPGEAFANLRQRNLFATLTSIGLVALLALRTTSIKRTSTPALMTSLPGWAYPSALLLALGNAASSSRTGLLEWGLVLVLVLCWNRSNRRPLARLAVSALLMYGLAVLLLPTLLTLATGISSDGLWGRLADNSGYSRRVLWDNVRTLIAQKPWFGWGWGELDYAHFITDYPGARFMEKLDNAHNLPLHLAVELGVPLALLICVGLTWAVLRVAPWRDTDPVRQMAWAVLGVIGVHSLLEYPLWYGPFQLALLCCVALLWRTRQRLPIRPMPPQSTAIGFAAKKRHFAVTTAAATLLALGYVGFDYTRVTQLYVPVDKRWPAYQQDTLAKVQDSWLFASQVSFATLLTTDVTLANAPAMQALALSVLHYSPEAKVVEKLITSALLAGQRADAEFYQARFCWAYPMDCARAANQTPATGD
jgi:O-antigen ligase